MPTKVSSSAYTHPRDFLYLAGEYCDSADLLRARVAKTGAWLPSCLLYFHATELAYKAFLLSHGYTIAELTNIRHKLNKLHKLSITKGLNPPAGFAPHLRKVTEILAIGNGKQAYRYQGSGHVKAVNLEWAKLVVRGLVDLVAARLTIPKLQAGGHVANYAVLVFTSAPGPERFKLPPLTEFDLSPDVVP